MKRDMHYRTKTLEQLIGIYAHECGRESVKDSDITKLKVVNEVYARIKSTFEMIENEPDNVESIYKSLIQF